MSIVVDIEGIDFEKSNVFFVNGLTLEKVKIKYNWLLNAKVKDAIVGEDARGLVWYFGDWYCGEWLDGTWYSGNFYDGVWKNGLFYSYKLNKFDVVNDYFFIVQTGNQYSQFHNGYWLNGTFFSGTFGVNSGETWTDYQLDISGTYPNYYVISSIVAGSEILSYKKLATWMDGIWVNGLFYDAIWNTGQYQNGLMQNSKWINGYWYNGTFNGHTWHNGYWYNGQFILGTWINGTFTQLNTNIISRFGNTTLNTSDLSAICTWKNGLWKNGEFFSGYVTGSTGLILDSIDNYLSIWEDGTWKNGIWYGGHFLKGTWEDGVWKNGIFGYIKSTDWTTPNLVSSEIGWSGNTLNPTYTTQPELVVASNTANTYYELDYYYQNINDIIVSGSSSGITGTTVIFTQGTDSIFNYDFYNTEGLATTTTTEKLNYNLLAMFNDETYTSELNGDDTIITSVSNLNNNVWKLTTSSIISNVTSITFKIKVNAKLDSGNGSGQTYWGFNSQIMKSPVFNVVKVESYHIGNMILKKSFIIECSNINCIGNKITITDCSNTLHNGVYNLLNVATNPSTSQVYAKTVIYNGSSTKYIRVISSMPYSSTQQIITGNATMNSQNVSFVGSVIPSFNVGDYIYIEQNKGYVNSTYNGLALVMGTGTTGNQYYITTSKKYKDNSTSPGKIVNYLSMYSHRTLQTPSITFQNLDFNLDFIVNTASTLINGFAVKFNYQILHNDCYSLGYDISTSYLPMKHLSLYESGTQILDSGPNGYDYGWYNLNIYQDILPTEIYRYKNLNSSDDNKHLIQYGGVSDIWGLSKITKYYTQTYANINNPSYTLNTNTVSENYDPHSIISVGVNDKLKISTYFNMFGCINQQLRISDIKIKSFYSNELDIPVWKNGTWKRGTWYNGDFYDGDFLSGLWIKGNFYGGNMAADYR